MYLFFVGYDVKNDFKPFFVPIGMIYAGVCENEMNVLCDIVVHSFFFNYTFMVTST